MHNEPFKLYKRTCVPIIIGTAKIYSITYGEPPILSTKDTIKITSLLI